jgi:Rod binding domain-containing protein
MDLIEPNMYANVPEKTINGEQEVLNRVRNSKSGKEQLQKVAKEFESVFISKMFSLLDKTVDREGGILGEETKYFDNLKSYMYDEVGRSLASNPRTSFGFAKQIYTQMEKFVD